MNNFELIQSMRGRAFTAQQIIDLVTTILAPAALDVGIKVTATRERFTPSHRLWPGSSASELVSAIAELQAYLEHKQ